MPSLPPSDHTGDPAQYLRVGRIMSVDRAAATCTVALGDPDGDEVLSADVPWGVIRAGGTIIWSPPTVGEQIILLCPEGDIAQAVPFGALYSDFFPAPGPSSGNAAREFIRLPDGAEFGYDPAARAADATLPDGATLTIIATGGVSIDGPVSINGNVTVTGTVTASDDVEADGISLVAHTHNGVQSGGASTGGPQ